ncbi:hypothetical protein ACEXQE_20720 [Herbiconiux sp. P17]|uniref:hypothetical protein n=1 Tax=Herbiconiux wuyangfengii TaxID=3342794 RepID=UPI0035B95A9E
MQADRLSRNTARTEPPVMRAWGAHTVEAIDYELVWIGHDPERAPLGRFTDAHAVDAPVWRFVSGYLMFSAGSGDGAGDVGARLVVSSHGQAVAGLRADATGFTLDFDDRCRVEGSIARTHAGIAVVADPGTELALSSDRRSLSGRATDASSHPVWGVTVVHGPAPEKVENRIQQLRSLQRVGGRNV